MQSISRQVVLIRRHSALLSLTLGLLGGLADRPAHATILLFDQQRDAATGTVVSAASSGGRLPSDYGDHAVGATTAVPGGFFTYGDGGEGFTPDIVVDIFSAAATPTDPRVSLWQNDFGDLVNVIFGEGPGTGGADSLSILFSAAPGYQVDLYGFELAGWSRADYTIAAVEVFAGPSTLFSQSDVLVEGNASGPGHTTFAFDVPLSAPEILLRLDLSNLAGSVQDNIGLDSVRFGQTPPPVPEPGTATLLFGGLVLLASARSNRSR